MSLLIRVPTQDIAAIRAKTDNLPSDPADESLLEGELEKKYSFLDFWCQPAMDKVTITGAAVDILFNDIVVAGLPTGLTLRQVKFLIEIANLKDTSGSDNYINAASKTIRLMLSGGTWGVNDVVAITLDQNSLYTSGSGERGGPTLVGPDIKAYITQNGTYNVRSEQTNRGDALVALANDLECYDVAVGLRFIFG